MVNFRHTIVATCRPDLLERAVESVRPLWRYTSILDNSDGGKIGADAKWPVPVIRSSVPLSSAQSMNFMHRLSSEQGAAAFGYQHEDAAAEGDTAEKFLAAVESALASNQKWASIWTQYDILSAYNMAAVDDVGPWDTAFPQPSYDEDVDWFYRARVKGYEIIKTDLPVTHMDGGSVTIRDPARRKAHDITFPLNSVYYLTKWGGPQHGERFKTPWNE